MHSRFFCAFFSSALPWSTTLNCLKYVEIYKAIVGNIENQTFFNTFQHFVESHNHRLSSVETPEKSCNSSVVDLIIKNKIRKFPN